MLKAKTKLEFKRKRNLQDLDDERGDNPVDIVFEEMGSPHSEEQKSYQAKRSKMSHSGEKLGSVSMKFTKED